MPLPDFQTLTAVDDKSSVPDFSSLSPVEHDADYNTILPADEESDFLKWKQQNAPDDSGADYDFKGAFNAGLTKSKNGHWPDTYKKPNHETFSDESIYAQYAPEKAGHWNGENYIPAGKTPDFSTLSELNGLNSFQPDSPTDLSRLNSPPRPQDTIQEKPYDQPHPSGLDTTTDVIASMKGNPLAMANIMFTPLTAAGKGVMAAANLPTTISNRLKGATPNTLNFTQPLDEGSPNPLEIPKLSDEDVKTLGISPTVKGVHDAVIDTLNGLTQPESALTLPLLGLENISKPATAAFAAQLALNIPDSIKNIANADTAQEKAKAWAGAVIQGIMLKGAGEHGFSETPTIPEVKAPATESPEVQSLVDSAAPKLPLAAKAVENLGEPKIKLASTVSGALDLSNAKTRNQNQLQTRTPAVTEGNRQVSQMEQGEPPSITWLKSVAKGNSETQPNPQAELSEQSQNTQIQQNELLGDSNGVGIPIRTSPNNAESPQKTTPEIGTRSSQEPERIGQPIGKSSTANARGTQQITSSPDSKQVVDALRLLREVSDQNQKALGARTLLDLLSKNLPAEQKQIILNKIKELYASNQSQDATIYGNVQPQPIEGQGQVPAPESSGGIQPQANGGLPSEQARTQGGNERQVLLNQTGEQNEIIPKQTNVQQDIRQQNSANSTDTSTSTETAANSGLQPQSTGGQGSQKSEVLLNQKRDPTLHLDYTPEDLQKYQELKQKQIDLLNSGKTLFDDVPLWREFESLMNKYNGNPPKQLLSSEINKGATQPLTEQPPTPIAESPVAESSKTETPSSEPVKEEVAPSQSNAQPIGLGQSMGNAVPKEFERAGGNPTAMKYRLIDQERQQRGLPPITKGESVSDQVTMDKAMAAIDLNPKLPELLVKELNSKPRPISDVENHVLMLHKIELRDAYEKSARAAAQAYDDSNQFPDRGADLIAHNIETARISDELTDLENASRKSGSERGRALRSLKVMANEDFSLPALETKLRASKGGEPLTDEERSGLVKTADDYKAANEKLTQHIADRDSRISELENQQAVDRLTKEAKQDPQYHPAILRVAEKIVAGLDRKADAARQRIKERGFRFNAGVDPTVLLDVAEIGASYLGHAVLDFTKWSLKMKEEFGKGIELYLKDVYAQSQKLIDDIKAAPAVKRAITKQDLGSKLETTKANILEKVSKDETDDISGQVQKLAKLFIQNGVNGREAVVDSVHGVLSSVIPDWTRRKTMDAISGYGDFKQLSKDEISVKLRGIKGELQQISKLQDMAEGVPPRKTGMERRRPTDEERALIKAVNEAKIKFQVPITDPSTQLKSALDTRKTQLTNQIADYERRLKEGDFSKKPKRELTLDRTAQELQAQKERIVKDFKGKQRKYELAQRTGAEKVFDFISNARRFSVLSGVNVLAKLAAYSATKVPSILGTEGIGGVLSNLPRLREIAAKAPSEGGLNVKALANAVAKGLTQGFVDAYKTARTGSSDLKSAFSDRIETGREWYNFFQTIHEVIKAPLRRTAFELSLSKRMEAAAKNGADITDPLTQVALAKDAYLDSDRALLLESNKMASGIRGLLKQLEAKDKATGQVPLHGKIAATIGRVELPILTVPLNYIKQTLTSAFGLVSGSIKARAAFKRGIDTLSPQEADSILRHLKYGTVGGALLLYGFYDGYKNGSNGTFGGYYEPGEKRKDNQAGVGGIKIGDTKISGLLLHNPLLAVAQLGHTIGAIANSKIRKRQPETHGVPAATVGGLMGLLNDSPLGRTFELAGDLQDPRSLDYALGEHIKGLVVPQLVQEAAQHFDKDANGKPIKRDAKTVGEHIKTGIPGLRETVKQKR